MVKQTFVNFNKAAWCHDINVDLLHVIAICQLEELYDVIIVLKNVSFVWVLS